MPIKTWNILLLALLPGVLLLSSIRATPSQTSTTDVNAPVGIYQVSAFVPNNVSSGQVFNMTVRIAVTGINQSTLWYNTTLYEGIESISFSLVEGGIHRERITSTTMITNTNVSVTPPLMPIYVINVTSVEHVFTFNSSFLDPDDHSWVVTIKGFRWALLGLAIGYSNFYIQTEGAISITGESVLAKYIGLLAEYDNLNSAYDELQTNYDSLQNSYNSLNSTYNSLKTDYDNLKSKFETSTGEVETARNLSYMLTITTIVFVISTAYLIFGKPKVKPT